MKIVINSRVYSNEYLTAMKALLTMAGFYVDDEYQGDDGDLAIYACFGDVYTQTWILETLRNCDVI